MCASSGTLGHSLSLGRADAAVVVAHGGALADAVATAVANHVKKAEDIEDALEFGRTIPGVTALVVIKDDRLGSWGEMEIVPLN